MYTAAMEYYNNKEYGRAITLFEMIIPAYRGKSEAENLYYTYADAHYKDGSFILSSHYFKTFSDTYTASPKREEALYMTAYSEYKLSPRLKLDQSSSNKAIDAFQIFVNTYPNSPKVAEANKYMDELRIKMELKSFETGLLYYQLKNYSSAIKSFENMLRDFPGSVKGEEALYLIAKASREWAQNSIFTRQQERYAETIERCDLFKRKYPRSEYIDKVNDYKNKCQEALNNFKNG
jgi:outer membrane protein assembly factor BamD